MMPKVFVAPGHGRKPSGTFDPGAVGHAGARQFVEHDFNTKVANALADALRRCKVEVVLEDGGGDHDPNFIGSTKAANDSGADYAVEVHHNAAGGSGSEVVVNDRTSAANRQLAGKMAAKMAGALGIRNRGVLARAREHFNRETGMPSCIPECAFVDSATDQAVLDRSDYATTVAEAICEPLCEFLGVAFQPGHINMTDAVTAAATGAAEDEEGLTMADANEIMAFLQDLKKDMVVQGTPSLEVTVEKFAEHQREALAKLRDIEKRLTKIEQHLGQ
jgi:N-acetylmuramoyl-L-alanine amidase